MATKKCKSCGFEFKYARWPRSLRQLMLAMLLLMMGIPMLVEMVMNPVDMFATPEDFNWRNFFLALLIPCGLLIWAFLVLRLTVKQVVCPKCGTINECRKGKIVEDSSTRGDPVSSICKICQKPLVGKKYDKRTFDKVDGTKKYDHIIGFECQNCGACYCKRGHKKELGFSWWSGHDKSICLQCKEPLRTRLIISDISLESEH